VIAVLVFVVVVVVAADRVGALVAEHVLAGKVQTDEHLPNRPDVTIGGFPFLTQAAHGRYKDVTVKATDFPVGDLSVTRLTAHLYGVHISLSDAIHRSVSRVPVERVVGTAFVSYSAVNSYLAGHGPLGSRVSVHGGNGGKAEVVDRVEVAGRAVSLRGEGTLTLSGNTVDVGVTTLAGLPGSTVAAGLIRRVLASLSIAIPVRGLPFRMRLSSVSLSSGGVTVAGSATNVVLGSRGA